MTISCRIYMVCPHCKRPVVALRGQSHARCAEHGDIVPMRSGIANPPRQQEISHNPLLHRMPPLAATPAANGGIAVHPEWRVNL